MTTLKEDQPQQISERMSRDRRRRHLKVQGKRRSNNSAVGGWLEPMERKRHPRRRSISLDKVQRGRGGIGRGGPWRDERRGKEEERQCQCGRRSSDNSAFPRGSNTTADLGHNDNNLYVHCRFDRLGGGRTTRENQRWWCRQLRRRQIEVNSEVENGSREKLTKMTLKW